MKKGSILPFRPKPFIWLETLPARWILELKRKTLLMLNKIPTAPRPGMGAVLFPEGVACRVWVHTAASSSLRMIEMFPAVESDKLIGRVTTREVKEIPKEEWSKKTVGEITVNCSP
jgi:hypothetical protein